MLILSPGCRLAVSFESFQAQRKIEIRDWSTDVEVKREYDPCVTIDDETMYRSQGLRERGWVGMRATNIPKWRSTRIDW
jgi:hypothetical protein